MTTDEQIEALKGRLDFCSYLLRGYRDFIERLGSREDVRIVDDCLLQNRELLALLNTTTADQTKGH